MVHQDGVAAGQCQTGGMDLENTHERLHQHPIQLS